MASSGSPVERVYHFVSDPDFRENLSGRVRAACVTCRRKKIKCSGEPVCITCQEKGIVCEGFPQRKRSRRSLDVSSEGRKSGSRQNSSSSSCGNGPTPTRDLSVSKRRNVSVDHQPVALVATSSVSDVDCGYITPSLAMSGSIATFDHQQNQCLPTVPAGPEMDWDACDTTSVFKQFETMPTGRIVESSMPIQSIDAPGAAYNWQDPNGSLTWWFNPFDATSSLATFADPISTAALMEEYSQPLCSPLTQQTMHGANNVFPRVGSAEDVAHRDALRAAMSRTQQFTMTDDAAMWVSSRPPLPTHHDDLFGAQSRSRQRPSFDQIDGVSLQFEPFSALANPGDQPASTGAA